MLTFDSQLEERHPVLRYGAGHVHNVTPYSDTGDAGDTDAAPAGQLKAGHVNQASQSARLSGAAVRSRHVRGGLAQGYAIETDMLSKDMERDSRPLPVLRDVNFHAEEGEFVSIIGPSGCGKSTLLNIIAGLDSPTSGSVALHGSRDRRRLGSVGYMQQKDLLMPWRSVLDNAVLGLELQGVSKREASERARQHLGRFGLEGFENAYPHELSGGMRQRAAFLRTVLADQEVFLLDEPFGALDALNRTQIHQWVTGLWESMQKTIVLVTHDVDEAILLSDRVYVMTARPGTMKMAQRVDIPRPRSMDVFSTPEFMTLKSALLTSIREEADDFEE